MKLMISALALAAMTATAGMAQTLSASDEERIRLIAPDADLSMLTAEQAEQLTAFVAQGVERNPDPEAYVTAVLEGTTTGSEWAPATVSASTAERIRQLVPNADLSMLNAEQAAQLTTLAETDDIGSAPGAADRVNEILAGNTQIMPAAPAMLNESDAERILVLVPDANLDMVTEEQAVELAALVNSDDFGIQQENDAEQVRLILAN